MPYLNLEVSFLTGQYGGEEWPPAPMRLLQALVAGVRDGTHPALCWLETLAPPAILAESEPRMTEVRTFVPNNTAKGTLATPTEKASRDRVIRRLNQAVRYIWEFDHSDRHQAEVATQVATKLHTLGTGQDMCSARAWISDEGRIKREPERALWQPFTAPQGSGQILGGVGLRVPIVGSMTSIETRHQASQRRYDPKGAFVPPVLPPASHRNVEYFESHQQPRQCAIPVRLVHPEDKDKLQSWPSALVVKVAGMLRHGVMEAMQGTDFADWAAGHVSDADLDARLSWVPLPSIGQTHADRRIRRALLIARLDAQEAMVTLYQKLLNDQVILQDDRSGERSALACLPDDQDLRGGVFRAYCKDGTVWQTVTPIALPGDYAHTARLVDKLIRKALAEAGIDTGLIQEIETSRIPFDRHDPPLSAVALKAWRAKSIPLTYARIKFTHSLRGPLVIGRGRHFGLGLLCANP